MEVDAIPSTTVCTVPGPPLTATSTIGTCHSLLIKSSKAVRKLDINEMGDCNEGERRDIRDLFSPIIDFAINKNKVGMVGIQRCTCCIIRFFGGIVDCSVTLVKC